MASVRALEKWIKLFKEHCGERAVLAVCGNKIDLLKENSDKENTDEEKQSSKSQKKTEQEV